MNDISIWLKEIFHNYKMYMIIALLLIPSTMSVHHMIKEHIMFMNNIRKDNKEVD